MSNKVRVLPAAIIGVCILLLASPSLTAAERESDAGAPQGVSHEEPHHSAQGVSHDEGHGATPGDGHAGENGDPEHGVSHDTHGTAQHGPELGRPGCTCGTLH